MSKPGVMFYFEIRPCIKRLTLEEKGALFEAILDYGEHGTFPELDGAVGVAWDFIQQRLDRDTGRYDEKDEQSKYAVSVREARKAGIQLPAFEKWRLLSDDDRERLLSGDIERCPTSKATAKATAKKERADEPPPARHRFGEYGNVLLSDEDLEKLKTEFPTDWNERVERLSEYMASSGKTYKNHLATIRKWAKTDEKESEKNGKTAGKAENPGVRFIENTV